MEVEGTWMSFETLASVPIKGCILVAFSTQINFEEHATYQPPMIQGLKFIYRIESLFPTT